MRVVIGTYEVCGWIHLLGAEFERQGHSVITISNKEKYRSNYSYTIERENFARDYINFRIANKALASLFLLLFKVFTKLGLLVFRRNLINRLYLNASNYFSKNTDLYIHVWEGLEGQDRELEKFKKNNAKIVSWFVGSEIRNFAVAIKEFNIINEEMARPSRQSIYHSMRKLRIHEKYSDAIFSVPDQSSLALRPYFHLQVPIKITDYEFKYTNNDIPVLVHVTGAPLMKGTAIFEKVIDELKEEGLTFEFRSLRNISNIEVRKVLTDADILLDELYLHGPGMLGFEAMASGCCVLTKYLENSPACFRPPVVSVNEVNLKEKLRELILDKNLRKQLVFQGVEYVTQNNAVEKVCELIMNKLTASDYDYYPSYFRNKFEIENYDVQKINELTTMVRDETWYKDYVPIGPRDQLSF